MSNFKFDRDSRWLIYGHPKRFYCGREVTKYKIQQSKKNMFELYKPYVDAGIFDKELNFTDFGKQIYEMTCEGIGHVFENVPLPFSSLLWGNTATDDIFDFL